MRYKEITIQIADDPVLRENLMALMLDAGFDSFMETENNLLAYVEVANYNEQILKAILKTFGKKAVFIKAAELPDQNWNEVWESNYEPVLISHECIVRAPFHPKTKGIRFDVVIHPKMSFGTAHHATTFLMANLVLRDEFKGLHVLDMGTGTGILAIMASMRGASKVTAIDNDEWSYNNALENCDLNAVKNIEIIFGDASAIPDRKYHVLLANINRNILLNDLHHYSKHLEPGARVYLSGFYEPDLNVIVKEAEKYGWSFSAHTVKDDWVAAVFRTGA